jgi:hypothetical protein
VIRPLAQQPPEPSISTASLPQPPPPTAAPQAGTTEVAIDRLPGAPDGVSRASDGNFWVAVLSPVPPIAKLLGEPGVRAVFAWMPDWARPAIKPWGTVIKVGGRAGGLQGQRLSPQIVCSHSLSPDLPPPQPIAPLTPPHPHRPSTPLKNQITGDGEIVDFLHDPDGSRVAFVSAVSESKGRLFVGNLVQDYVSVLDLAAVGSAVGSVPTASHH